MHEDVRRYYSSFGDYAGDIEGYAADVSPPFN